MACILFLENKKSTQQGTYPLSLHKQANWILLKLEHCVILSTGKKSSNSFTATFKSARLIRLTFPEGKGFYKCHTDSIVTHQLVLFHNKTNSPWLCNYSWAVPRHSGGVAWWLIVTCNAYRPRLTMHMFPTVNIIRRQGDGLYTVWLFYANMQCWNLAGILAVLHETTVRGCLSAPWLPPINLSQRYVWGSFCNFWTEERLEVGCGFECLGLF